MEDTNKELRDLLLEFGVYQKVRCQENECEDLDKLKTENKLPDDIYCGGGYTPKPYYYRILKTNLQDEKINQYLFLKLLKEQAKQSEYLQSIKNAMIFFVILTIISLICTFILMTNLT